MAAATPNLNAKYSWKKDPLRETLKKDLQDGRITPEMKPLQASKVRPEYEVMQKAGMFGARLRGMRQSLAKPEKEPKKPKWTAKNPARIQMKWDVAEGHLKPEMDVATAKKVRAMYNDMDNDQFTSRWAGMRDIVARGKARAAEDTLALKKDRLRHPRPKTNFRGEPEWNESDAKELLSIDMDNDLHKKKTPQELWLLRNQYQEFQLQTFRGHIHQEVHTRKWRDQWVDGKKDYTIVTEPFTGPGNEHDDSGNDNE